MDFNHYGILTDTPMPADEVAAITDIAHEAGFAVMAHANGDAAVSAAIAAGIDSVEHGAYLTEETLHGNLVGEGRFPDEAVKPLLAYQEAAAAKAAALGAYLAPGSDAGAWAVPHGKGGLDEQHWLREALGSDADAVLERGAAEIRKRF